MPKLPSIRGVVLFIAGAIFSMNYSAQNSVQQRLNDFLTQKQIVNSNVLLPISTSDYLEKIPTTIDENLITQAHFLEIDSEGIQDLRQNNVDLMSMNFDLPGHGIVSVGLYRQTIFTPDFTIETNNGPISNKDLKKTLFYRGAVLNVNNSIASLTIADDQISGVISIDGENYTIGKIKNSETHILYNEANIDLPQDLSCGAADTPYEIEEPENINADKTIQCIRIRVEVDSGLTENLGGAGAALNYVAGLYNEVITLFDNDDIDVNVSEVYVWQGTSPYSGNAFQILQQMSNTSPNADVTSLVSSQGGGGIAWVGGLCGVSTATNYSGVFGNYNTVPVFSSDVYLVTHEIGHNLGSQHTHACAWNGNDTAIDGCGPASGNDEGCDAELPIGGGTIMSYCNQVGAVGVDFTLGFGPQPGERIRSYIDSRTCLGTICVEIESVCNDGILNGLEEDIDCGGPLCPACPSAEFELNLKTFLEGPYDSTSGIMKDDLRTSGQIPLDEPYTVLGFSALTVSTNIAVLGVTGDDAIVDWILVELRDPTDPTIIVESHAALLQRDGDIVGVDGGILEVDGMGFSSFYIALRHRNHLGIRTAIAYDISGGIAIDFTDPSTALFGTDPMTLIGAVPTMYSGNANLDQQVNSIDKNVFWRAQNAEIFDYETFRADFNLDGTVNSVDKNAYWRLNNSVIEQLD